MSIRGRRPSTAAAGAGGRGTEMATWLIVLAVVAVVVIALSWRFLRWWLSGLFR